MGDFNRVAELLYGMFGDFWTTTQAQALQELRVYFNDLGRNPRIRIWVDAGADPAIQSTSVRILRTLAGTLAEHGFEYPGIIEVVYDPGVGGDTRAKLDRMLLELRNGEGMVGTAYVVLTEWHQGLPLTPVTIGISGAALGVEDYAYRLNSRYMLRLAPYVSGSPHQIQLLGQPTAPIDLTHPRLMATGSLVQRGYFHPPAVKPPKTDWESTRWAKATEMFDTIVQLQQSGGWRVGYVDQTPPTGSDKPATALQQQIFDLMGAALETQRDLDGNPVPGARNIALVTDGYFTSVEDLAILHDLINGGMTPEEQSFKTALEQPELLTTQQVTTYQAALGGYEARMVVHEAWHVVQQLSADDPASGGPPQQRWEIVTDIAALNTAIGNAAGKTDRVIIAVLGPVPEQMVQWGLDQELTFPPALSRSDNFDAVTHYGGPYLRLAGVESRDAGYPAELVLPPPPQPDPLKVSDIDMYNILRNDASWRLTGTSQQLDVPLWQWDPDPKKDPAGSISDFVLGYDYEPEEGPFHSYFRSVKEINQTGLDDKLGLGLAALRYVMLGQDMEAEREAKGGPPTLQALMARFLPNTHGDELWLAPGVFTDDTIISGFYVKFLESAAGLRIADPVYKWTDPSETMIQLEGTTAFHGLPLKVKMYFTAPDGIVLAEGHFYAAETWSVPEVPWIRVTEPEFILNTPEWGLAPVGATGGATTEPSPLLGAVPEAGKAAIAVRLPAVVGKKLLSYNFDLPQLNLDDFFALIGGVDAVRSLPAPFNSLGGFGVRGVQLAVDLNARRVDAAGLLLGTDADLEVLPGVTLTEITAGASVQNPGDLAKRKTEWAVRAKFGVEDGIVLVSANGPELVLKGSLKSGVIKFASLVNMFAPGLGSGIPGEPKVSALSASITPSSGDYEVSCEMEIGWSINYGGQHFFDIEKLKYTASRVKKLVKAQIDGHVTLIESVPLALTARYESSRWSFSAAQAAGSQLSMLKLIEQFTRWNLTGVPDYKIADLKLAVTPDANTWEVSGRSAEDWYVPFLGKNFKASFKAGRAKAEFGRLEAQTTWMNIPITAYYDYNASVNSFGLRWGSLEGKVTGNVATLAFSDNTSLGSVIETMVSWATGSAFALEAPWSLLNSIQLPRVALTFDFTTDAVSVNVDIGPIDLGFARVDSIGVVYDSQAEKKVAVTLNGSFPWNTDGKSGDTGKLGPWDTSKPGTAPTPPGLGNKYLDVRMIALGQHVTKGTLTQVGSVPEAIEIMESMKEPSADTLPEVTFDPAVGWMVGADLGFVQFGEEGKGKSGYLLTTQVVFNDPLLYALRLALAGDQAKIFDGLDFQIMYRQVSDTVGVYQAELALPDRMRHLTIGAYSVTLPIVAVAVYTNGDFQVDVGFPWGGDFGRSFTIEGVVAPGIPVTGSAGFYFGRLSSASTNRVPQAVNGTFNPVLVFGFGMSLGFGKQVEYGPLKAGFSLTAAGIIEGVLATWNPYQPAIGGGSQVQLQDAYYFWLRGTFGIAGRLYGSVDFSVIKADVNVNFSLMLQVTYEAYTSMSLTVIVAVDVSVSVRIDLGIFSIRLSFDFSMRLRETLTIDNGGNAPWQVQGPAEARRLRGERRHTHLRQLGSGSNPNPRWDRLTPAATKQTLDGWILPSTTVAKDENSGAQVGAQVLMAFIEAPQDSDFVGDKPDTSFDILAKMVLRWVISALQDREVSPSEVDGMVVRETTFTDALDELLVSTDANPTPIDAKAVDNFMENQFRYRIQTPPATSPNGQQIFADAALFPFPPYLSVDFPAYNSGPQGRVICYLSEYNSLGQAALNNMRSYFDKLAVQVSDETKPSLPTADAVTPMSMASWVLCDYFLLVARQMVQLALDALRNYHYEVQANDTPQTILTFINGKGDLKGDEVYTVEELLTANATQLLAKGVDLVIGPTRKIVTGDSFNSIADANGLAFTATTLAQHNAARPGMLTEATIVYPGNKSYQLKAGQTLVDAAWHLGIRISDLISSGTVGGVGLLAAQGLLRETADLALPYATYQAASYTDADDVHKAPSFYNIAKMPAFGTSGTPFTAEQLADANAASPILRVGAKITYDTAVYIVAAGDTLADIAPAVGAKDLHVFYATSGILVDPSVIADVAVLILPELKYATVDGDTLSGITTKMATTIEILAMAPANLGAKLFPVKASLDVPHLPKFALGSLLDAIKRTGGLHQLSRLVSRYGLHGTRLPTKDITPNHPGAWVTKGSGGMQLPPNVGLYALTGQQIVLPTLTTADISMTVAVGDLRSWFYFDATGNRLTFKISANSSEGKKLNAILAANKNEDPIDIGLISLGQGEMTLSQPASYPLTTLTQWFSPTPVRLPYGKPPSGGQVPAMRIWSLPPAMSALPQPGKVSPRFALTLATYDENNGATVKTPIEAHGWASAVSFTVKHVPPVGAAATTTYEIVGASGADAVVLERMVAQVTKDSDYAKLIIGFTPAGSDTGLQTGNPDFITMGIAQANLSTTTRPSALGATLGLLDSATEFVRLLWEAGITRAGGFYLYYYDTQTGQGLPAHLFDDRGEATVQLLAIYSTPDATGVDPTCDRLTDYMTSMITSDPYELSVSVVAAESNPKEKPVHPDKDLTLDYLADSTYSDLGDLAFANRRQELRDTKAITVTHALFQIPPDQPMDWAAIATRYPMLTAQQIADANPQLPRTGTMTWPTALYLPTMNVVVGTHPSSGTLEEIAGYYFGDLTRMAADNAGKPGLFKDTAVLEVTGGPMVCTAVVAPGVATVGAVRKKPVDVPLSEQDSQYGQLFLQNTFSMLSYQVMPNAFFTGSVVGLPAGPENADYWEYAQAIPFPNFAAGTGDSPYRGIGGILQVNFSWQDYYGNTLRTAIDAGTAKPYNQPPMLAGYTDALMGVGQWPSISAAWQVLSGPSVSVGLTFDPTRYQGPSQARTTGPKVIGVWFLDKPAKATAEDIANYQVDGVTIIKAELGSDYFVNLTTQSNVPKGEYLLKVSGVTTAAGSAVNGTVAFTVTDTGSTSGVSSAVEACKRDLPVYSALYYQLTDPLGVGATIEASLCPQALPVDPGQWSGLLGWLFQDDQSIYNYLSKRSGGMPAQTAASCTLTALVPAVRSEQIFELTVDLVLRRTGGVVIGELAATAGVRVASLRVPAMSVAAPDGSLGLEAFAAGVETVFADLGLRVAVGIDRASATAAAPEAALWAVRMAPPQGGPITYSVSGPADLFAPRPVANQLVSMQGVYIYDYTTDNGIPAAPTRKLDFIDVDLDGWCRTLFGAIDEVLTPQFTAGMQLLQKHQGSIVDHLQEILDQKQAIADAASKLMIPLFDEEHPPAAGAVQESFRQQLLERLSNAYAVKAALQYRATVSADPSQASPPQLFGAIRQDLAEGEQRSEISLTSPKLALAPSTEAVLPFLMSAPDAVHVDGVVAGEVKLNLAWQPSAIEHQIAPVPGVAGYQASSWLSFVRNQEQLLDRPLGTVTVPLALRAFPASPSVVDQDGKRHDEHAADLNGITKWDYVFTWSLPFHYLQDRVHGRIDFNVSNVSAPQPTEIFKALAEFVTVYPSIRIDLDRYLAAITAATPDSDSTVFKNADTALTSFVKVVDAILAAGGLVHQTTLDAASSTAYTFELIEGPGTGGVLEVTLIAGGPEAAEVRIPGYQTHADGNRFTFTDPAGQPLMLADAQSIPARSIALSTLDILQCQDAWAAVSISRNENLAAPFVYQTPEVRFPDAFLPTIDADAPIDIASLGSGGPHRTLPDQLNALFDALLSGVPDSVTEILIQTETVYEYDVSPGADPIALPVFFQPPIRIALHGDQEGSRRKMVGNWSDVITAWRNEKDPSAAAARLRLDLTIYSTLTRESLPLLRLRNAELAVADIIWAPPPPVEIPPAPRPRLSWWRRLLRLLGISR